MVETTQNIPPRDRKQPPRVLPAEMMEWYELIYGGLTTDHRIEQRYRDPAGWNDQDPLSRPTFHSTIAGAAHTALRRAPDYDVYCGMAWRRPGRRGRKEDCNAAGCLWLEADAKQWGGDLSAARQCLEASPAPLSVITYTGGGFHGALLLDVVDLRLPGMADRVEAANRSLARAVSGAVTLDDVWDLPRILRPPATLNHKYSPPRLVEAVWLDGTRRYTLKEVEDILRRLHPQAEPLPRTGNVGCAGTDANTSRQRGPSSGHDDLEPPWEAWLAQAPSWPQILEADGWTLHSERGGVQYWTRPDKNRRAGSSASVGFAGLDVLHMFSSSVTGLKANANYGRWAYHVCTRYGADYAAAARALAEQGYGSIGRHARENCGGDLRQAAWELAHQRDGDHVMATDRTSGVRVPLAGRSSLQGTARRPACLRREVVR